MGVFLVTIISLIFFIFFQSSSIYGGDAGDLVSAAFVHGVAHPPGYPLYTVIGAFVSHIPISTVAWRMALLSSIPAIATLVLLFILIRNITKDKIASIIAIATLACTYLFWLYAIVAEVFMLYLFFATLLMTLLYFWKEKKDVRLFYAFLFSFGLSLTHHHLVATLIPGFAYWIYINRQLLPLKSKQFYVKSLLLVCAGILPYSYVIFASHGVPIINWNNPDNLSNFIRLVTRATYGTFQSAPTFGNTPQIRLLQIPNFLAYLADDFTVAAFVLIIIGAFRQFKTPAKRTLFYFLGIVFLVAGPIYLFYASYLITGQYMIATFERFLLPSYVLVIPWLAEGIAYVRTRVTNLLGRITASKKSVLRPAYGYIVIAFICLIPISIFRTNYPKLAILKNDRTAEHFGQDLLSTPVKNSILILDLDNPLFDAQYMYYTQHIRQDIVLIHGSKFVIGELHDIIKKYYPNVIVPTLSKTFFLDFLLRNYAKYPIYSNVRPNKQLGDGVWLPNGLLYRFYLKKDLPPFEQLIKDNIALWKTYHNPLQGSLGKYQNLMLADVISYYRDAHIEAGKLAIASKDFNRALSEYMLAYTLTPATDTSIGLMVYNVGTVYEKQRKCYTAIQYYKNAISLSRNPGFIYEAIIDTYKTCLNDPKNASLWTAAYEKQKKQQEKPLESL